MKKSQQKVEELNVIVVTDNKLAHGKTVRLPDIGVREVDEEGHIEDVPVSIYKLLPKPQYSLHLESMELEEMVAFSEAMEYPEKEYAKFTKNAKLMSVYLKKKLNTVVEEEVVEETEEEEEEYYNEKIPTTPVKEEETTTEEETEETETTEESEDETQENTEEETEESTEEETETTEEVDLGALSYTELVQFATENNLPEAEYKHIRSKAGMVEYLQSKIQ